MNKLIITALVLAVSHSAFATTNWLSNSPSEIVSLPGGLPAGKTLIINLNYYDNDNVLNGIVLNCGGKISTISLVKYGATGLCTNHTNTNFNVSWHTQSNAAIATGTYQIVDN